MIDAKARRGNDGKAAPGTRPTPGSDGAAQLETVWSFTAAGRWRRVRAALPDFGEGSAAEVEAAADRAGWFFLDRFGPQYGPVEIEVYQEFRTERNVATVWIADEATRVLLPDWPSLFGFLCQAAPLLTWAEGQK
jgi:hypothetical protein